MFISHEKSGELRAEETQSHLVHWRLTVDPLTDEQRCSDSVPAALTPFSHTGQRHPLPGHSENQGRQMLQQNYFRKVYA